MPSHHRPAPLAQTFVARSAAPVALPLRSVDFPVSRPLPAHGSIEPPTRRPPNDSRARRHRTAGGLGWLHSERAPKPTPRLSASRRFRPASIRLSSPQPRSQRVESPPRHCGPPLDPPASSPSLSMRSNHGLLDLPCRRSAVLGLYFRCRPPAASSHNDRISTTLTAEPSPLWE